MPKHLTEYQEGYIKGKLENNVSWAMIKKDFQKKFGRTLGQSAIDRVSKKSKKIKGAETRGRKRKNTTLKDAQIFETIRSHNRASWVEIAVILKTEHHIELSEDQIISRAHENGIFGYKIIKKPKLTEAQTQKRLSYAKSKQKWAIEK